MKEVKHPNKHYNLIKLRHTITGHSKGKWQTKRGLKRYIMKRKKLNNIKKESRRRNRV